MSREKKAGLGWPVAAAALVVAAFVLLPSPRASAFDGGYHVDLTRDAMVTQSFGSDAIGVAQVSNWYDDGFESAKKVIGGDPLNFTIPLEWIGLGDVNCPGIADPLWGGRFGPSDLRDRSDTYMHFDQLANYNAVKREWDRLVRSTYNAVLTAQNNDDPAAFLAVMGMTLHQVQDFYSHSNWAEISPAAFGGECTWFDVPDATRRNYDIYTHHAGVGHDVLNKDISTRPNFPTAYREAYYASAQWVSLLHAWVTPAFWEEAKTVTAPDIQKEYDYVRYLCWYAGHWRGPSSSSWPDYAVLAPAYLGGSPTQNINTWKAYAYLVTAEPDWSKPYPPMVLAYPEVADWAKVDTTWVRQTDDDLVWDIDPGGQADFYAYITVNGLEYLTPMHGDADSIHPNDWLTLVPLFPGGGANWLDITYNLWDEDVTGTSEWLSFRGSDDHCDIVPAIGSRIFRVQRAADDLAPPGEVFSTDGLIYDHGFFEDDGEGDEALVAFRVTVDMPARRPRQSFHVKPGATAPPLPATPLVSDDGEWTAVSDHLDFSWSEPTEGDYNLPDQFQYRVTRIPSDQLYGPRTYQTVRDWTSAGTALSATADLTLEPDYAYFVEVKAHNAAGWSYAGRSDGIRLDAYPPVLEAVSARQEPLAAPFALVRAVVTGTQARLYPNSLAVSAPAHDVGSGLETYRVWIESIGILTITQEVNKIPITVTREIATPVWSADIPADMVTDGRIEAFDLPLEDGMDYRVRVVVVDKAGNTSGEGWSRVTATFEDATPPPAPAPTTEVLWDDASPLTVRWDDAYDPESGIVEYFVATSNERGQPPTPDQANWVSVGRATSYDVPRLDPHQSWLSVRIWVKAINGMGLESAVGRADYQTQGDIYLEDNAIPSVGPDAPIHVLVMGSKLDMDADPVMIASRVFVPMRFIFEALGARVNWDQATRTVVGTKGPRTIRLTLGQAVGYVNGQPTRLDAPCQMIGGRVFVPLRFIAEALNANVNWNGLLRLVTVEAAR